VFEAVRETLNPRVFYAVVVTGLALLAAALRPGAGDEGT